MNTAHTPCLYLVDDDEDDRNLLQIALRHFLPTAMINSFNDGSEFVRYLNGALQQAIDLIILDLNMPVMCGQDVLKWIHKNLPGRNIPILIFSTSRAPEDIECCKKLGAGEYIPKPNELAGYENVAGYIYRKWFSSKSADKNTAL